jgi:transposase, IS6 family
MEVAEWLAERGVAVDPSTVYDWVQVFTPRFLEAARAHRTRAGTRWRVDETLLKIGGRWRYVFRAIDERGQVVDVYLSDHRDAASARAFFERAITETGVTPTRVTSDKATCSRAALRAVLPGAEHRSSKYLNNGLERDHQFLKGRVRSMRRFKATGTAGTCCRGHALIRTPGAGSRHWRRGFRRACGWPPSRPVPGPLSSARPNGTAMGVREVLGVVSTFVPRALVRPRVEIEEVRA